MVSAPAQAAPGLDQIWRWLAEVPDPEIPVVSVVDLGIVRDVAREGGTVVVTVTPTYSGCPATSVISMDVETRLRDHGINDLRIETRLSPAWTSAWIGEEAQEKLRRYGIAPPTQAGGPEACPHCGAKDVEKISQFGSTPCKASWRCRACLEPFDYFKCI